MANWQYNPETEEYGYFERNVDGELVSVEEIRRELEYVDLFTGGMDARHTAEYFLRVRCQDPDFEIYDALSTLKRFDNDFKAKGAAIFKYQLKSPDFEYTLFSDRGLACFAYLVEMAHSDDQRAAVFQGRLDAFCRKLLCCKIPYDLMEECLDGYYAHLNRDEQLFWNRDFNWSKYWKLGYQYDVMTTRNEQKVSKKKSKSESEPKVSKAQAKIMARKKAMLKVLMNKKHKFLTVQEIKTSAGESVSAMSDDTVRRELKQMVADGLIEMDEWIKMTAGGKHSTKYYVFRYVEKG